MIVSAIVAVGKNRVIGKHNKMLWKLPLEMQYFKQTTMGHHLIMGRKTFESHPPLPGRTSIIVTRNHAFEPPKGCFFANSVDVAIEIAKDRGETEVFITGGAEIYKLALPFIQKLYITEIEFTAEGDAYFPDIDLHNWKLESQKHMEVSEKNPLPWTAKIYSRK